jgi:hypothetical protein
MRCNAMQTRPTEALDFLAGRGESIACGFHDSKKWLYIPLHPTIIVRGEVCSVQGFHNAD